ncbi:hypothetical protein HHUSO_G5818 [Huso huso]|uniref:Uncharacterized protein n=1 Tax=Huso huso TaxID=61971 RepID=A0ABR1A2D6_HUSHU
MNCCMPNICVTDDRHTLSDGDTSEAGHHKLNFSKLGKFGSAPTVIKLPHPRVAGPSVIKCGSKHILVKGKPDSPITQDHLKEIRPGFPPNQQIGHVLKATSPMPFPWPRTLNYPQYVMVNKNNQVRPVFSLPPGAPNGVPAGALAYNMLPFQQASPDPGNQDHKTDLSAPVHGPVPYAYRPGTQRYILITVPAAKSHPHSSPLANLDDPHKVHHEGKSAGWTASSQPIHVPMDKGNSQGGENRLLASQPTLSLPTFIPVGKMVQVKKSCKTHDGGKALSGR